ncbi:glutathione S-transferase family protein [Leptolyngbya sp. FACHB-711]|uniref:glutathione S-transferase family protein n=1 Tax=unclassified Leptolyngbya TaxID=2650499 RepID=UPI0016856873|nr:glutathione S-transferase family protein [Leptolyngbya sp. FACHB-711]MBD1852331.1 glutathione S-transferase family protein [Cyanobacteria bacterium FACHB-502]MBD2024864.1 glutathione S-transferase family protein [Leptolyngbya sp. FACHB-711]
MYKLYDFLPSGNGYKVRLLLTQLGISFELILLDVLKSETRTPEFLAKNPNGRIPVLEITPGEFLSESNAILIYLSQGTDFLPLSPLEHARVMQWLFFEQYSHEPFIATSRFWLQHDMAETKKQALAEKQAPGYAALGVMEQRLKDHPFLVNDRYTIADIALFAYTHVAHEGNFDLSSFPGILQWIDRVKSQPNYIEITDEAMQSSSA